METKVMIGGRQKLRSLELKAFRCAVDALRAQGALTKDKQETLKILAVALNVSEQRYRSEIRRAVNDETLTSIARIVTGRETEYAWRTESMRKVPLVPMVAPENMFTPFADTISDIVSHYNQQMTKNLILSPSVEKIQNANVQANIERLAEEKILYPIITKMKFEEQKLLEELNKIKCCSTFSHPDDYLSMIDNSLNFDEVGKLPLPREETVVPSRSPKEFSVLNEEILTKVKEAVSDVSKTVPGEFLNEIITKVKSTSSALDISKSARNVPLRSKKRVVNSVPRIEIPEDQKQTTRMVRKAKLNAKRWNPKTKTLESPTKREIDNLQNDLVERNIVKIKRPPTRKRVEKVGIRQLATNADGDAVERTVCSTQRGRQTARWLWGRDKKVQKAKKSPTLESGTKVQVDDSLLKLSEKFRSNIDEGNGQTSVINPRKKSKRAPKANNKTSLYHQKGAIKDSSPLTLDKLNISTKKSNSLSEEEWLHGISLVPTSRPINILRKRVCSGGAQIQASSKKICSSLPSVETIKNQLVNSFQPDVFTEKPSSGSTTKSKYLAPTFTENVLKKDLDIISAKTIETPIENSLVTVLKKEKTSITGILKELAGDSCEAVSATELCVSSTNLDKSIISSLAPKKETILDPTPTSEVSIENYVTIALPTEIKELVVKSKQPIEKSSSEYSTTKIMDDILESNEIPDLEYYVVRKSPNSATNCQATTSKEEITKSSELDDILESNESSDLDYYVVRKSPNSAINWHPTTLKEEIAKCSELDDILESNESSNLEFNVVRKSPNSAINWQATTSKEEIARSSELDRNFTTRNWKKETNCDSAINSKEFISNSVMDTPEEETEILSIKSLNEELQSDSSDSVKQSSCEDSLTNRGGVKILRPGCGKNISDLLGSNVRVRTVRVRGKGIRKILPQKSAYEPSKTMNLNEALVGKEMEKPVHLIEHLTDVNPFNILMTEEVLSGSDDDMPTCSPATSVHDSPMNECMIVLEDREQKEDLPINDCCNSNLIQLDDLKNDLSASQSSVMKKKSVQEVTIDTISEINEDWEDGDCIVINSLTDEKSGDRKDKENNIGKIEISESVESTSMLPKPKVTSSLLNMIGYPPWAPKIIKANTSLETTYGRTSVTQKIDPSSSTYVMQKFAISSQEKPPDSSLKQMKVIDLENRSLIQTQESTKNSEQQMSVRKNGTFI